MPIESDRGSAVRFDLDLGEPRRRESVRMDAVRTDFSRGDSLAPTPSLMPGQGVTHMRSTLLCSSIEGLRVHGLGERYFAELTPELNAMIRQLTAGLWVPIEIAVGHYAACDRLNVDPEIARGVGAHVGKRLNKSVMAALLRVARQAGMNPWAAIPMLPKIYEVTFRGGSIRTIRSGPKEGVFEFRGLPLGESTYFRTGFAGLLRVGTELFCTRAFVREIAPMAPSHTIAYRISWV